MVFEDASAGRSSLNRDGGRVGNQNTRFPTILDHGISGSFPLEAPCTEMQASKHQKHSLEDVRFFPQFHVDSASKPVVDE